MKDILKGGYCANILYNYYYFIKQYELYYYYYFIKWYYITIIS